MTTAIDDLMETASQALAQLQYARCETLCLEALAHARLANDWVMAQRVLLPLQEARRQLRQAAIDGAAQLGVKEKATPLDAVVSGWSAGVLVLTWPYTASDAAALELQLREAHRPIEVLFADNHAESESWTISTYVGPRVSVEVPAPKPDWVGRPVQVLGMKPPTPAHWFMKANEALGDAAIQSITSKPGTIEYFDDMGEALSAVGDHEILHQRLADAARALQEAQR